MFDGTRISNFLRGFTETLEMTAPELLAGWQHCLEHLFFIKLFYPRFINLQDQISVSRRENLPPEMYL